MIEELDDVINEALKQGLTVELTEAERYGYQIVVDGKPLFAGNEGLPRETFSWPIEDCPIEQDSRELVKKMLRDRNKRMNERRMRRLETANQCASEGEELPIHE